MEILLKQHSNISLHQKYNGIINSYRKIPLKVTLCPMTLSCVDYVLICQDVYIKFSFIICYQRYFLLHLVFLEEAI